MSGRIKANWVLLLLAAACSLLVACNTSVPSASEPTELPAEAAHVVRSFWESFAGGDYEIMVDLLDEEPDRGRDLSIQHLASEAHIPHDSDLFSGFRELRASITSLESKTNGFTVTVAVQHPRIGPGDTDVFRAELAEMITDTAATTDTIDLDGVYSHALAGARVEDGETHLEMSLRRVNDRWLIAETPEPGLVFASFRRLRRESLCSLLEGPVVELDEGGRLEPETRVDLGFAGTRITGKWDSTPSCAIKKTTIVLPGDISLGLADILDSLSRHPFGWKSLEDHLGMGPEDFTHRGWFVRDPQGQRVALALTRRYAVATVDTAFGYVTPADGSVGILSIVPGPVDHLAWAPDGRHLALAWTQSAKGGTDVDVYDVKEGRRRLSLTELLDVEHHLQPVTDISWSDDGLVLRVEVREDDGETTTWLLDTREESATLEGSS